MAEQPPEAEEPSDNLPAPAQHTTADYEKFAQPEKPIRNWNKIVLIFIIVLLVAGVAAGAYWYLKNHKSAAPTVPVAAQPATAQVVATTKSYTSPNLYLTFSYPSNWVILDSGGGVMTAISPTMQLKTASGQKASGKIVMTVRTSATSLTGFTTGNAAAVIDSQKITYIKPTQTQRADTYVTLITYPTTTQSGGLDAIYVTGNNGYTKGQAVPQADLLQVSPIISLTFVSSTGKTLTIAASNWDDSTFYTPLLDMLKSFSIT